MSKDSKEDRIKGRQPHATRTKAFCVLVGLILSPLLIGLGLWQLQRADAKRLLIQQADSSAVTYSLQQQPQQLPSAVALQGYLLPEKLLLLDNRTRSGRVGYELLSLFQDAASGRWGIVNLGWIAAGTERGVLPVLPQLPDFQQRVGLKGLQLSADPGFMLGTDVWLPGWPKIIQQPDLLRFEQLFQRPLYPAVLRLTEPVVERLDTHWDLVVMPAEKHLGYAVQWFALALALLLWLFWFGWRRTAVKQPPQKTVLIVTEER